MNKADKVEEIIEYALYRDDEILADDIPVDAVIVKGVVHQFGFHPGRIAERKDEIKTLLDAMPDVFHKHSGGGMSFLNLCTDKKGEHWAEHPTMDQLMCLGMAAGMASFPLPRTHWDVLPGGMPYVTFDTEESDND